jgi:hypothetical protein
VGARAVKDVGAAEQLGDDADSWLVVAVTTTYPERGKRAARIVGEGVPDGAVW